MDKLKTVSDQINASYIAKVTEYYSVIRQDPYSDQEFKRFDIFAD